MLKKIALLLIVVLFITGCSSERKTAITFSSWGSISEIRILKSVIKDYEKEHPKIKINFIHIPQNYFQKLHLLFASNTPPDVIFINNLYLPIYKNHLLSLNDFPETKEYHQSAIEALSIDENLYAIPRDISSLVFYINKNIIKNYPETWDLDNLLKIAINSTNSTIWGISFEEDIYWALPYITYYNEDITREFNPQNSKGLTFYKNLRDRYHVAPTKSEVGSSTLAQMFLEERIGIYLSGRWMYPKIKESAKFNWEIKNFPNDKGYFTADASGWAISKNTKNKKEALDFITYLASKKTSQYFTNTGLIVPARKDNAYLLNNTEHNEKVFIEIIENSKKTPVTKDYKKLIDILNSKSF